MRFRNPSRTGGCCDPCSDLNAKIEAVNSTATAALAAANTAIGIANAQAAAAAASAASAASDAAAALAAVASKVSIRTTTGTFVYSHTNATEGEIAVINDAATPNTIPARDGSGYIITEDPPSNDSSKKATTTAWAIGRMTDGSVTKIGTANVGSDTKPIKLVAGVPTAVTNDLVSTKGNQTIQGLKTFDTNSFPIKNASDKYIRFNDASNVSQCWITGKADGAIDITVKSGSYARLFNQRNYDSANINDIATIGTLDAYTPMVRTTGNQTILGTKTFTRITSKSSLTLIDTNDASSSTTPATLTQILVPMRANDDSLNILGQIIHNSNGDKFIQLQFYAENGTYHTYVLGGIKADGTKINPAWAD